MGREQLQGMLRCRAALWFVYSGRPFIPDLLVPGQLLASQIRTGQSPAVWGLVFGGVNLAPKHCRHSLRHFFSRLQEHGKKGSETR